MERLTERLDNGQAAVLGCGNNCKYDFKYCHNHLEDCPTIDEIYERLAQYEDLGVTPEQVREIDGLYRKLCEKLNKYRAIEERLENMFGGKLPLETVADSLERVLTEPDSPHPVNAQILTHAESAEWEEYLRLVRKGGAG